MAGCPPTPNTGSFIVQSNSYTVPNWDNNPRYVVGLTPFGYYDNNSCFTTDSYKFAQWAATRLGYPNIDIELQDVHFYTALEEAINTYATEVYSQKIKDNYLYLLGMPSGSNTINNTYIKPNLNYFIDIAESYGAEAGIGGNVEWYTGSIELKAGQQIYDLNEWASSSLDLIPGDKIEVRKILHNNIPESVQYYGEGNHFEEKTNIVQELIDESNCGCENKSICSHNKSKSYGNGRFDLSYVMFPLHMDLLRIQAMELNQEFKRSHYSFEVINNKLRIFPIPTCNHKVWFHYSKKFDRFNSSGLEIGNSNNSVNLISNPYDVPFNYIDYCSINQVGKNWIWKFGLILSKLTLGYIRGKYSTIPIPDSEISLDGSTLRSEAEAERTTELQYLRDWLDGLSKKSLLEKKASEDEVMEKVLSRIPLGIYIY